MICECSFGFYQGRCSSPKGDDCKRSNWNQKDCLRSLAICFRFRRSFLLANCSNATEGLAYFRPFGTILMSQLLDFNLPLKYYGLVYDNRPLRPLEQCLLSVLCLWFGKRCTARGLELLGPLVRMIIEIMVDMMLPRYSLHFFFFS